MLGRKIANLKRETIVYIRGLDTLDTFSTILYKGDQFCDFLFCFLTHKVHSEKGSPLKGKNLAHFGIFENGVLLMYTLEGVSSVANLTTAYEESH